MIKNWVYFLHKSFRDISQLSTGKISGQLNFSTLSYDHLNKYYSFGHFPGTTCWSPGLGQFLGQLGLVLWLGFLHQSCAIICLVSCKIGLHQLNLHNSSYSCPNLLDSHSVLQVTKGSIPNFNSHGTNHFIS